MAARSLNKAQLIGNLTRDPELRYTPQGTAVCTLGLATNRAWVTDTGEKREETEFHRIVAWNKLAELCAQLLFKGRKIFVEGRLQTRRWTAQDGTPRQTTEVVISDMIILDSKRAPEEMPVRATPEALAGPPETPAEEGTPPQVAVGAEPKAKSGKEEEKAAPPSPGEGIQVTGSTDAQQTASGKPTRKKKEEKKIQVKAEDIPF